MSTGSSLQNSRVKLLDTGSSFQTSGNTLTVTFNLEFFSAFDGAKNAYVKVVDDDANMVDYTDWGDWTIP